MSIQGDNNLLQNNHIVVIASNGVFSLIVNFPMHCGDYDVTLVIYRDADFSSVTGVMVDRSMCTFHDVINAVPITTCLSRGDLVWLEVSDAAGVRQCVVGDKPLVRLSVWMMG